MTSPDLPAPTAALAARLVQAQFPQWAHLPVLPVAASGWDNATFHLGDHLLVRLPRAGAYANQVEIEQRWLPRLARRLPAAIPQPVGRGAPGEGFPWPWSIYRWLDGETAAASTIVDDRPLAGDLAAFLNALHRIDASGGPAAGRRNFHRGGKLAVYDGQTGQAIAALDDDGMAAPALAIWEAALASTWERSDVWVHGDLAPGNILVSEARLAGVIDFGQLAVGDPACDLVIAWTFLGLPASQLFRAAVALDDGVWARARGWALWKASILFSGAVQGPERAVRDAGRILQRVLAEA
jgi:aminoglycoside phosphotransferase (APT) family kinase protein